MKITLNGSIHVEGLNGRNYWVIQDDGWFGVKCSKGVDTLANGLGWKTIGPALTYINRSIISDKADQKNEK